MKVCEVCEQEISTKDGDNRCAECERKAKRRKAARVRRDVYASLGMVRVRGALGGVYHE